MVLSGIRRARRRPGAVGRGRRLTAPRRAGARRSPRRDGPHRRRRCTHRDRGARALERCDRRRTARRVARDTEPGAQRRGPRRWSRTRSPPSRHCSRPRDCRRTALWCFAISAEAGPASRWPTRIASFDTIGETVRYPDFSGDQIDQALLNHVVAGIADASNSDPASTAAVGSLARLRNDCRLAKEQLSAETAAAVHADFPGSPPTSA